MEAKDTVMGGDDIRALQRGMPLRSTDFNTMKRCIEAQAEITWDKAIREAVEWLRGNGHFQDNKHDTELQAKLKGWGID